MQAVSHSELMNSHAVATQERSGQAFCSAREIANRKTALLSTKSSQSDAPVRTETM